MNIVKFTEKNFLLLKEIKNKGSVNSRTQTIYTPFAFYVNITFLKDLGIVFENGFSDNNRKMWSLTERGKGVVELVDKFEKIMGE